MLNMFPSIRARRIPLLDCFASKNNGLTQMDPLTCALKKNKELLAIIAFSLLLKIFFLFITREMPLSNDQIDYYQRAIALVDGKGFLGSTFKAPLHPFLIAIIFYLFNNSIISAIFFQVILSTLNVFVIYCIGKRIFNKKVGLISALIFSLYPTLIFFSITLWTETLFNLIFSCSIYFIIKYKHAEKKKDVVIAGILWGFASLTRGAAVFFIPFIFLWFIFSKKRFSKESVKEIFIFSFFAFIIIAPWTYRNCLVQNNFVLITTGLGDIFRTGNNSASLFIPVDDCWHIDFTDGAVTHLTMRKIEYWRNRKLIKSGLEFINQNRLLFMKKCLWEACHLFTLDSFALRHLRRGVYEDVSLCSIRAITIAVVASYAIVAVMGLLGFVGSKDDNNRWLFIIFTAYIILVHSITVSMSRYRIPFMLFFIIYASFAFSSFKTVLRDVFHSYRFYIFLLCTAFFVISWYMSAPLIYDMLSTGGQHFQQNYCFE